MRFKFERTNAIVIKVMSIKNKKVAGEFIYSGHFKKWLFHTADFCSYSVEGMQEIMIFFKTINADKPNYKIKKEKA